MNNKGKRPWCRNGSKQNREDSGLIAPSISDNSESQCCRKEQEGKKERSSIPNDDDETSLEK